MVRKKIFIFINPNTFNEKSLIKYLAHEIAIISDQKIKFIKKELFLTQKILNIENLDSNDFYPMYTFSIITNPILHSVFSMIRANKFENIVFDEINELKTSDFFNKKNLTCIQILEQNLIEYLEFYNHQNVPILSLYNHAYIESLKKYVARFNISTKDKKILFSDLLNFDKLRDFMQSHVSITSKNDYCGELSKIDLGKAQFTLSSMGPRGNVGGGSNQIDSLTLSNLQDKFYIALTSQYKYTVDLLNQLNVNDPIFYEIDTFYKSSENEK